MFAFRNSYVFDGELYDETLSFTELQSLVRSEKRMLPNTLKFFIFDILTKDEWSSNKSPMFERRVRRLDLFRADNLKNVEVVDQIKVNNAHEAEYYYKKFCDEGYEGAILRCPFSTYKHGRATLNEGSIFKFKKTQTIDCKIIGVNQRMQMTEAYKNSSEYNNKNELGYAKRTHKAEHFEPANEIGSIVVKITDNNPDLEVDRMQTFAVNLARGLDLAEMGFTWDNHKDLLGREVEVEYQAVGNKDKPRMGRLVKFK